MSKAFVLINCELGSEKQVISDLKTFDCVKKVNGVFGTYDILADLECNRLEELRQRLFQRLEELTTYVQRKL